MTEYVLVKIDRKEYYALGTGLWDFPLGVFMLNEAFDSTTTLSNSIRMALGNTPDSLYLTMVSTSIWGWCQQEALQFISKDVFLSNSQYSGVLKTGGRDYI